MNRFLYLIILLFIPMIGFPGTVKITGAAPGAEGKRIEVITYNDYISLREKIITYSTVDTLGNFTLTFDLDKTIFAYLSIDFHKAELFFQPSRTYKIKIEPMDYKDLQEINPFIQAAKLDLSFEEYDATELNALTQTFNNQYNEFLLKNFNALYRDRNRAILDTFTSQVTTTFASVTESYLKDYIRYKLAGLVELTQAKNKAQIGKIYFSDSPILYENVEYMDFFNQYFSKYLTATSRALKFTDYKTILDGDESYRKMMKALEADTLLRKPQLRELVLLKGLMEMFNSTVYSQEKVLNVLNTVESESKFPENKKVAAGIIQVLTKLRPGTPAPAFKLKARQQKEVTMADFKGKLIVINFWTTYCQGCVSEMDLMKPLFDKYNDRVNFISISADKDYWKTDYFISLKKDFVWNFLHIGDDYNLLKEYDVRTYPLFVILDQEGKILKYPAELPSAGLEVELQKLLN